MAALLFLALLAVCICASALRFNNQLHVSTRTPLAIRKSPTPLFVTTPAGKKDASENQVSLWDELKKRSDELKGSVDEKVSQFSFGQAEANGKAPKPTIGSSVSTFRTWVRFDQKPFQSAPLPLPLTLSLPSPTAPLPTHAQVTGDNIFFIHSVTTVFAGFILLFLPDVSADTTAIIMLMRAGRHPPLTPDP